MHSNCHCTLQVNQSPVALAQPGNEVPHVECAHDVSFAHEARLLPLDQALAEQPVEPAADELEEDEPEDEAYTAKRRKVEARVAVTGNLNSQLIRELIAAGREITPTQLRAKQLEELAEGQKLAMEPLLESQRLSDQHLARLKQQLVGTWGNAVPSLMLFSACQSN